MLRNITIAEFESMITGRVLCDRLVERQTRAPRATFTYEELLTQGVFAANDVLKEIGINREAWIRVRGRRAYMFHEQTNRIMAELGVVSDAAGGGLRKRPRFVLLGKRGVMKSPTVGDLVVETAKLGASDYYRRGNRPRANNFQSSNGRTPAFGAANRGSSPCWKANLNKLERRIMA